MENKYVPPHEFIYILLYNSNNGPLQPQTYRWDIILPIDYSPHRFYIYLNFNVQYVLGREVMFTMMEFRL